MFRKTNNFVFFSIQGKPYNFIYRKTSRLRLNVLNDLMFDSLHCHLVDENIKSKDPQYSTD